MAKGFYFLLLCMLSLLITRGQCEDQQDAGPAQDGGEDQGEGEGEGQPSSLAEEYLDFLQGGAGGEGGEEGGCGAGGGGGGGGSCGADAGGGGCGAGGPGGPGGAGDQEAYTTGASLASMFLKPFREGYDKLDDETSKKRFGKIAKDMDTNQDGYLDANEVAAWVFAEGKQGAPLLSMDEVGFSGLDPDKDGKVKWADIEKDLNNPEMQMQPLSDDQLKREKLKFHAADEDKDGELTEDEFRRYTHPELFESMSNTLEDFGRQDLDEDVDGKVTKEEYLKGIQKFKYDEKDIVEDKFTSLDSNKDGVLSGDELKMAVIAHTLTPLLVEDAAKLIDQADEDKDGKLSMKEALNGYISFVFESTAADDQLPEGGKPEEAQSEENSATQGDSKTSKKDEL